MIHRPDPRELDELLHRLVQPSAAAELAALAACLVAAWAVVRLVRGRTAPVASVWFGDRIFDGVLFPIARAGVRVGARVALETTLKPAVFRLAIPILVSLADHPAQRARAARRRSRPPPWVRTVEHSISWLAWIAVVLWITGILPLMPTAMADISWKVGAGAGERCATWSKAPSRPPSCWSLALWISGVDRAQAALSARGHRSLDAQDGRERRARAAAVRRAAARAVGRGHRPHRAVGRWAARSAWASASACRRSPPTTSAASSSWPSAACASATWSRSTRFEGRITDIRTRYTIIRSLGGRESIVPNETLITQRVENASLADPRVLDLDRRAGRLRHRRAPPRAAAARARCARCRASSTTPRPACSSPISPPTAWTSACSSGSATRRTGRAT